MPGKISFKILFLIIITTAIFSSTIPLSEVTEDLGNGWYNAVGYQSLYEYSEKDALRIATQSAQKAAIEKHSGVQLKVTQSRIVQEKNLEINRDDYLQISNFLSEGIVTDSKFLNKEVVEFLSDRYLKVEIKVRVQKIKGEPDPNFKLEANLDRNVYKEGDPLVIDVRTSKDSYLYVFNIAPDQSVSVLLPNKILKDNFVKKSTLVQVPPKKSGVTYRATLLPEQESFQEIIKIIAIKADELEDFDITLGREKMSLDYFYNMLLDLDRNQISEQDLFFTVDKKPE
tara:strand:- start:471 stop:1325 length:855 start_codon:yes stop_codon:yes gene_type:complete